MSLISPKMNRFKHGMIYISVVCNIWIGLVLLHNRLLLVESRQLLGEVLVLDLTARLLIEKEGDMEEAKKWICDAENRIAQYTVERGVQHSELPLVVEQRKKLFIFLGEGESTKLRLYVARTEGWWTRMEGYLYTKWPSGREKWALWGEPHLRKELQQETSR